VPGLTNTTSAKHADIVEVAFEQAKSRFPGGATIRVVGTPVRDALYTADSRAESRMSLGLLDEKPTLLILGGSQGAQKLNYFFLENSRELLASYEIIHQVGRDNYLGFKAEYEFMTKNYPLELKKNYLAYPFLDDRHLAAAMNAADVIVSRAGSSIFEIAFAGKPSILIPLPTSANNHQVENAYAYANTGAAIVIEEENLLPSLFITQVNKILENKPLYDRMVAAAHAFYKPEAAGIIVEDLIDISRINQYYSAA
jgi:UDP-N-acetylglucosamine--N-acetylmuramyl-(pentapeptide) pyrophosphoryl-undecaprenol N-acetylglucosamine transferase